MSAEDRGTKSDEATKTLVGAKPIKMLEAEQRLREEEQARLQAAAASSTSPTAPPAASAATFLPEPPRSVDATGLAQAWLEELCLKHLLVAGELRSGEISRRTCLTPVVVEELLDRLLKARLIEVKGTRGVGIARTQTAYALTGEGESQADLALARDAYVGPAPVALAAYRRAVAAQTLRGGGNRVGREALAHLLADLVLEERLPDALGPAVNSGRSLLLFGPSGNGKTALCQRLARGVGGEVFVPRTLLADRQVIRIFDPAVHEEVGASDAEPLWDDRWVRCRRPAILVGAELTLADLELRADGDGHGAEAPVQLKASGGVLVIDDLGRQRAETAALLNRWVAPLDTGFDVLIAATGHAVRVPLDVFVIFSTSLGAGTLAHDAFLRRVAYKVEVARPDLARYAQIFRAECDRRGLRVDAKVIEHLVAAHYQAAKRQPNACEPRDLLDRVADIGAYLGVEPVVTRESIDRAAASYFVALR
jgi:predicted ATPase with chaperone activity